MNKVINAYLKESYIKYHTYRISKDTFLEHKPKSKKNLNLKLRFFFNAKEVLLKEKKKFKIK